MRPASHALAMVSLALLLAAARVATAGLVAHWTLDDGTGSTTAADSAGGHTGTLTNMDPNTDWVSTNLPPVPSGTTFALDFDGGNDHVVATGYKGITGTAERTVSAWIKTNSTGNHSILSWGQDSGGQKWIFRTQNSNGVAGAIRVEVNGGYIVGTTNLADDQWHHVAAVLPTGAADVQDMLLFVDGLYDSYSARQSRAINTASSADVKIGTGHSNRYFQGQIDDVRIYDHALGAADLWALHAGSGPSTTYKDTVLADLPIAYWRLGETSGTTAFSAIGGDKDRTYSGGVALGQPSLLICDDDPAARFDGQDDYIRMTDSADINNGGPYSQKTVELWFQADDTTGRQVIFEQGGQTRGLNLYLDDDKLYFGAWNRDAGQGYWEQWFTAPDPAYDIQAQSPYMANLVFDAATNTLKGYLNGVLVATVTDPTVGDLFTHGDDGAIGAMYQNSYFHFGAGSGNGLYFDGVIDDVSLYNVALSDQQILTHYQLAMIPEPGTLTLLGLGGLGLLARRKRNRTTATR